MFESCVVRNLRSARSVLFGEGKLAASFSEGILAASFGEGILAASYGASSEKEFWRQVGGASLVAADWQQIGPSSSFLNDGAVQCSDSTVQYILYCKYTV